MGVKVEVQEIFKPSNTFLSAVSFDLNNCRGLSDIRLAREMKMCK